MGRGKFQATHVEWVQGLAGVPQCYGVEALAMGVDHVVIVFKKKEMRQEWLEEEI